MSTFPPGSAAAPDDLELLRHLLLREPGVGEELETAPAASGGSSRFVATMHRAGGAPRLRTGRPTTVASAIFGCVNRILDLRGRDVLAVTDDDVLHRPVTRTCWSAGSIRHRCRRSWTTRPRRMPRHRVTRRGTRGTPAALGPDLHPPRPWRPRPRRTHEAQLLTPGVGAPPSLRLTSFAARRVHRETALGQPVPRHDAHPAELCATTS